MTTQKSIFGCGTGRSGGWLATNIMSVHSDIMIFNERIHFFRFIYGHYDPLTPANIERLLNHLRLRLEVRFGVILDAGVILDVILNRNEHTYKAVYQEIMNWLLGTTGKSIWGEYAPMSWRSVPDFLNMFPHGKVFHIYRDLRGVLASWAKMSFMPDHLYLNIIFNWIDSINHVSRFQAEFPRANYFALKFENIHTKPEQTVHEICEFLEVPFEAQLLQPERWSEMFDARYVEANVSSHDAKRYYGFNPKLIDNWRHSLEPWQLALCESLAEPQLESNSYDLVRGYTTDDLEYGLNLLKNQKFLLKNYRRLVEHGEGTQKLPNDPTNPKNWSVGEGYFDKFEDTPAYQGYLSELHKIEQHLHSKYA